MTINAAIHPGARIIVRVSGAASKLNINGDHDATDIDDAIAKGRAFAAQCGFAYVCVMYSGAGGQWLPLKTIQEAL